MIRRWLRRARGSRLIGQAALFAAASGLSSVLAGVASVILARELSPDAFGSLAFATSFLLFAGLFFELGVFLPAARAIARGEPEERRELIGAALIFYAPLGLAFSLLVFGSSFVVDDIFNVDAEAALRAAALPAFGVPFIGPAVNLAQGADRLHVSSVSSAVGQAAFVIALATLVAAGVALTTTSALLLRCGGFLIAGALVAVWLRPVFRRLGTHAVRLVAEARAWGFNVYVGRVLSIGTYNMDVLLVAAFTDAETVGFYALAGSLANFLGWPVTGLATALFARMTQEDRIDQRWLVAAWVLGLLATAGMFLLGPWAIGLVFGDAYDEAASLAAVLMLAQAVRGVTSVYNSFLSAQARGRELRNAAIVLTVSNLVLNFALIPPFGALGAAWASLGALVANYFAHVVSYRRALARLEAGTD